LSAGFQSWVHTPLGNPFGALANGIAGLNSGQRADPAGMAQQILQPRIDPSGNAPPDLNSQYQALRSILGDRNAMLAIVHPESGKALVAQALERQAKSGKTDGAGLADNDLPGPGNEAGPAAGGRLPDLASATAARKQPGYAAAPSRIVRRNPAGPPRKPKTNFSGSFK
jgi:hypothetical protein